ncbi:MAG TPA: MFS transporter [Pyrinomonadaceae bacterium]|nr:MFS transporter [Pyrinomonadaceae bacterium]
MTYRELLRGNADFRWLWLGQVVSEVGDWLNNIAVLALTIELAGPGREGLAVAVYAIARHLPLLVFGPIAGVAVDRFDRRRLMIASDVARAVLSLGFLAAAALTSVGVLYLVVASLFCVAAFFNAARRATIPNLARGTEELLGANSLSASTTAATIAVGSALGGVAATALGRETLFVINALTFLASAELIRRVSRRAAGGHASRQLTPRGVVRPAPGAEEGSARAGPEAAVAAVRVGGAEVEGVKVESPVPTAVHSPAVAVAVAGGGRAPFGTVRSAVVKVAIEFREGLRYVRRDAVLAACFVVAAGWGLGNGAARALYSIFGARLGAEAVAGWEGAWRPLVERPTDFGISVLFVAMGVGGVLGAPLARRFNSAGGAGLGSRMGRSLVLDGCGLAVFSLAPGLWTASLVLIAREMNFAIWWTAQQTIMMRRTEDRYAGRVFASFETLTTLTMVGAMFASGASADRVGIRLVAGVGGLIIVASGLLWFVLRPGGRAAERLGPEAREGAGLADD